ncbi:MAG: hypothetical protein ABI180_16750 [Microcoleus sp.]
MQGYSNPKSLEKNLREAAALFNQYGYSGFYMSDIMRVTGL